jgi:hypothetical protein
MSSESVGPREAWVIGNLHSLDRMATTVVEVVSIWSADAIVAVLASANMVQTLRFSWPLAIITGIALEGVGVVVAKSALHVRRYNQSLQPGDKPALEWLAWSIVAFQFAIGAVLICVNAVWTNAMTFGLITLSLLSGTATLAHMLSQDVQAREARREAKHDVLPSPEQVAEVIADLAPSAQDVAPVGNRERVMWFYNENPHASPTQAARELGMNRQTVTNWHDKLLAENAIPHNGDGGR